MPKVHPRRRKAQVHKSLPLLLSALKSNIPQSSQKRNHRSRSPWWMPRPGGSTAQLPQSIRRRERSPLKVKQCIDLIILFDQIPDHDSVFSRLPAALELSVTTIIPSGNGGEGARD
jgi:hypothetical protein